jgi:hypothetical protein
MAILIVLSVAVLLYGVLSLSEATLGVGLICIACYLGIMARITQASDYNRRSARAELERGKAAQVPPAE